jgi:uncharacterized membrane protein YiaA
MHLNRKHIPLRARAQYFLRFLHSSAAVAGARLSIAKQQLIHFMFRVCRINSQVVLGGINRLKFLKQIVLDSCPGLTDNLLMHILVRPPRFSRLISVSVVGCSLSDAVVLSAVQANRNQLRLLEFKYCEISDSSVLAIANHCATLLELNLLGNPAVSSQSVNSLVRMCSALKILTLSGCELVDDGALKGITWMARSLTQLDICECPEITEGAVNALRRTRRTLQVEWRSKALGQRSLSAAHGLFMEQKTSSHEGNRESDGIYNRLHQEICKLHVRASQAERNPMSHSRRFTTFAWGAASVTNILLGMHVMWVHAITQVRKGQALNVTVRTLFSTLVWERVRARNTTQNRIQGKLKAVILRSALTGLPLIIFGIANGRHNRLVSSSRKWVIAMAIVYSIILRTFLPKVSKWMIYGNLLSNAVYMVTLGFRLISLFETITF